MIHKNLLHLMALTMITLLQLRLKSGATSSSTSNTSSYQAVVATWKEVTKTTDTDGVTDANSAAEAFGITIENDYQYTITTQTIDYESLTQPYTLTFDLIWAILVIGQDKEFAFDLADLAYNSTIEITIYDNLTTNEDIDDCTYAEITDASIRGYASYSSYTQSITHSHLYENGDEISRQDGYIYKNVTTKTNTLTIALTKADTWIADYQRDYTNAQEGGNATTDQITLEDTALTDWTEVDMSQDTCGRINSAINTLVERVNTDLQAKEESSVSTYTEISSSDVNTSVTVRTRTKRVEAVDNTSNTTTVQKYIASSPLVQIKDDESTAENFVTLFNNKQYKKNKDNILSATEWLFEIIEKNEKIANTLDIIKYLLYKATGYNYGVTELDETLFYPGSMTSISSNITGSNLAEKVWNALIDSGCTPEAAAGVLGNIEAESGVRAIAVQGDYMQSDQEAYDLAYIEQVDSGVISRYDFVNNGPGGGGFGMCQWTYSTRKEGLYDFAKSRGVSIGDEDTQILYLLAELFKEGDAADYAPGGPYASQDYKNMTDIYDATKFICDNFENPTVKNYDERYNYALEYYNLYANN